MTKPQTPRSARHSKAPKAHQPPAPFVREPARPRKDTVRSPKSPLTAPPTPTQPPALPGARITRRAADRLRSGHVWVYASDIESVQTGSNEAPGLLPVADSRGILLGTALYSPSSQIALRLISREAVNESTWLALLEQRLRKAIDYRSTLHSEGTDSCRLCFSEADEIPGLVMTSTARS